MATTIRNFNMCSTEKIVCLLKKWWTVLQKSAVTAYSSVNCSESPQIKASASWARLEIEHCSIPVVYAAHHHEHRDEYFDILMFITLALSVIKLYISSYTTYSNLSAEYSVQCPSL